MLGIHIYIVQQIFHIRSKDTSSSYHISDALNNLTYLLHTKEKSYDLASLSFRTYAR